MKKLSLVFLLVIFIQGAFGQLCGFDERMRVAKQDPIFAKIVADQDDQIREIIKGGHFNPPIGPRGVALYTIPVVVHVVHTGGDLGSVYNPADDQILQAIDYVNKVWDGTASGMYGGVGDLQIKFALARRDPNCNPTNGIDRVNGSSLSGYSGFGVKLSGSAGATDLSVKNQSRWDPSKYYNIWVVNKIDGADGTAGQFTAGYAYFPGSSSSVDGTIMLATQFRTGQKTLPHELGHAFALYHPFQGSSASTDCPSNSNCNADGDQVCDTDPISNNVTGGVYDFSCRTGINNCTGAAYSINTENNVMSYTNCFTLFTEGQKNRILSAMLLPSRAGLVSSLGATPPGEGSVVCTPKLNFETAQESIAEAPAALMDCRKYKDYVFNLTIGSGPSVQTTATLTIDGGTATSNQDFILSTNGDFAEPSSILTFPAGSAASQPFTIRVFDDGSIESPETVVVGFTVNNGGGNAVKGDARLSLQITIVDNDSAPVATVQKVEQLSVDPLYSIGSADASQPFDAKLSNKKTTWIYKASELLAKGFSAGNLTGLAIYLEKNSVRPFLNLQIKMGLTTREYLVDGSSAYLVTTGVVKSIPSYATLDKWNAFVFDAPFVWDGIKNVVVEFCYNNGIANATESADIVVGYSDGGSTTQGAMYWQNNLTCAQTYSSVNYYSSGVKPIALFSQGVTGPKTESQQDAIASGYLGPFADMFFYSATGDILGRIRNLSSWDYGCTTVKVDRAGTATKGFVNNTPLNAIADKTIFVNPANNNPDGQCEITLFFKKAEVDGYKAATGLYWSNTGMAKTKNAVSSYIPGSVPSQMAEVQASVSFGVYGEDSTITALFNTGLSGFGVVNAAIQLPVSWLGFTVKMIQGNALLQWETASEYNNQRFDVEFSRNGRDFTKVGVVDSRGNSSQRQAYSFTHLQPAEGTSFYRLRQVDMDGRYSYSTVLSIQRAAITVMPTLFPNPATGQIQVDLGSMAGKNARWELLASDLKPLRNGMAGQMAAAIKLPVNQLSQGVYFIRIIANNETHVLRFVKQ